ncbi:MAG: hypothetical protein A2022_10170 [Deltaproteobacteria bacterium GWF2_42_12]|nr:MAG: hypothetical protein A2090_05175 [Deltaproteobacteria bacterium GWD2_42_10]OGP48354.1 MAG: hypothetical protein A2022_10170 [Deltaproteobacteria bacterium GWF2_42_12]
MNDIELDALTIRLVNSSSKEIKDNLLHGRYKSEEIPYVEGYLPHKIEEERNAPVTLYHRRKAPEGKIFKAYEVSTLKKSWVDSPSKIKKDIRDKLGNVMKTIFAFWCKEYKWILGFILTTIALYLTYIKLTTNK